MPGVPSGRGCDACRKQKKKCDQSKPACSRCTRLRIPCIGSGEQRYKFKNQTLSKALQPYSATTPASHISSIIRVPENPTTNLLNAYITRLNVHDIRYDLSCYGTFLAEVPKRLGRSAALDASVHALTVCSRSVFSRNHSVDMLKAYVDALNTLRRSICNPATSQDPDTLCAIYLMLVCQGWMGDPDDGPTCHGEGIAQILKQGTAEKWKEAFDVETMLTLCVPVILESIHNPRIQLNAWFWNIIDQYSPESIATCMEIPEPGKVPRMGFQSMKFRNMAKIAEYVHYPAANLRDIENLYRHMQYDQAGMRNVLDDLKMAADTSDFASPGPKAQSHKMVRDFSTAYGVLLTLMLILNGILQAFNPADITLIAEVAMMGEDTLRLGEELQQYRPLGASYIPMCLAIAWAAIHDPEMRVKMEVMMLDYQQDFTQTRWIDMAQWWEKKLELICLERMISQAKSEAAALQVAGRDPIDVEIGGEACCVQ